MLLIQLFLVKVILNFYNIQSIFKIMSNKPFLIGGWTGFRNSMSTYETNTYLFTVFVTQQCFFSSDIFR